MLSDNELLEPVAPTIEETRRLLDLAEQGTTDRAETQLRVPLADYGPARWQRECDEVFKLIPLAVAFSFDLPNSRSYKALDILNVPVLLTRDDDGVCRAFINVCTHRGVCLMDEGRGEAKRFVCPYHAWSFDHSGHLSGIPSEKKFGTVDREQHRLTALPCVERHGVIWISLTPGNAIDVDEWLGEAAPALASFRLEHCHPFDTAVVPGGNWKAILDGYCETYHFPFLHPNTRDYFAADLMSVDKLGRHVQIYSGSNKIKDLLKQDEADWDTEAMLGRAVFLFPNVVIGINFPTDDLPGAQFAAFHIYPGESWDKSFTHLNIFTSKPAETESQRAAVAARLDETVRVIRDEDYPMVERQMRGWRSGALTHNTYGRNEHVNQIMLHNGLKEMLG